MKRAMTLALMVALALAGACGNDQKQTASATQVAPAQQPTVTPAASLTPEQLGELGAQIRKDPARADELLARKGLNSQTFEKQIRDVTENPDASKRYAEAYRKASA